MYVSIEKLRKLSQNYQQILLLETSSVTLTPTQASNSLSSPPPSVCNIRLHAKKSSLAPGDDLSRWLDTKEEKNSRTDWFSDTFSLVKT